MNYLKAFEYTFNQYKFQLGKVRRTNSPDAVHDFRVAYKKILALLRFLINKDGFSVQEEEISRWVFKTGKIYNKGGKSRKYYLINIWIEENVKTKEGVVYYEQLKELETEKSNKFHEYIKRKRVPSAVAVRKVLERLQVTSNADDEYFQYCKSNMGKALEYLSKPPCESWHDARHILKDCYLLSSMKCFPYSLSSDMQLLCREMEQQLGKWHDLEVLNKFLLTQYRMNEEWDLCIKKSCQVYEQELKSNLILLSKQVL